MKKIKKLIMLALASVVSLSAHAQSKIYGNVIYSDNNATPTGIYSFNAEDGLTLEPVKVDPTINAKNGGVYVKGKYHFINMFTYYEYNAETWEQIKCENLGFMKAGPMQATALAYNAADDKVYGCFMDYTTYSYAFGTIDYDNAKVTVIKSLDQNIMRCMVATPQGDVYGINGAGTLYKFNKENGDLTEIGSTGMEISNIQGAICDPNDGTVYWAASPNSGSTALYTLDLETASTMLVSVFPNNAEITGLYILAKANTDGTPKQATNLKSNFPKGALTGNFTFTMPTQSNLDENLESKTDYKVIVDEQEVITGSADPGAEVTTSDITLTRGHHNVSVVCSNPSGESLPAYDFPYVGKDTPKAVANLSCTVSDNKVSLTWDAVTEGLNNGYIGTMKYNVVRYPGAVAVTEGTTATHFEETVDNDNFTRLYYEVTPANDGEELGETVACDPVTLGSVILPPYSESFNTATSLDGYTVIDNNADGKTWEWEKYGKTTEVSSNTGRTDDWLISPAIKLDADKTYKVSLALSNINMSVPQNYTVTLLQSPSATAAPLKTIATGTVLNDTKNIFDFINVELSGNYYIALQTATETYSCNLAINSLSVDAGVGSAAPAHATDLKAVPATDGSLQTNISFTTPTEKLNGSAIESISKVEIYRNDELIKTIDDFPSYTDFSKGINMRYTDTEAKQGFNTYAVVAYEGTTKGIETIAEVWVGVDVPQAPADIVAKIVENGINISWKPQAKGIHNGVVDTSKLVYYVEDNMGYIISNGESDTSVTINIDTNSDQNLLAYAVMAANEAGQSAASISNSLLIGAPYQLPLKESFASQATAYFWGITGTTKANFALNENASDLDKGCVAFNGSDSEAELYSGKLDMKGNEAVKLSFDYYCYNPQLATLEVKAYSPEHGFKTLGTIDMSKWNSYRWLTQEYRLDEYINDSDVQVYFIGKSTAGLQSFFIDNIRIEATTATDITSVKNIDAKSSNTYDILGRKLPTVRHGQMIINNGHKFVAK